jgi:cyclopropane fatty-acyl-phospholipid synthase-like methyltransferase
LSYIVGHSRTELQRLVFQAAVLRSITERLLRAAGVDEGMRVLDVGCGAGDVSILAAQVVGPTGSVVGIDRSPEAVDLALGRVAAAGASTVDIVQADLLDFADTC